jgi:adhesin/invasin
MQLRSVLKPTSIVVALAVLAACGETGPSEQLPPAAITNVTGVSLTGPAGEALSERVVIRVADASGSPLPGVTVEFAAGSGGSVDPATTITDNNGEARTRWTLGLTPGDQVLTVTAGGTTVNITAAAGSPRAASLAVNAGNNQSGTSGSPLATNPSVLVRNAAGAPLAGVTVFFSVMTGGGTIAQPSGVSDAQGIATAGAWTLGPSGGTQLLSAQVPQSGVANNPIVFSATAASGAPASVVALSLTQQSAQVGTLVASRPSVVVRDAGGNPVPNVSVTFAVTAGGGQLQGATQTTNTQGVATVTSWRVGNTPGTNTVTATVGSLTPVTFFATATAGAPAQLEKVAGDNQTAPVNRPVPIAPQVRVLDAGGNGVAGVTVNFAVASGDGSAVVASVATGGDGTATIGAWILGPTPGTNTLTATATGLTPVTFTATATGGTAISMQPVSLVTQTGTAGQAAGSPPSVVVRDALGNPVSGVSVTFAVTAGSGVLQGATQTTNANGIATVTSWTFGSVAGANTVVATATGLPSVTFNATTTGTPAGIAVFAGNNQAAVQGTAVTTAPSVRITDVNGQGVPGVAVNFTIGAGGGSIQGANPVTDATGVATVGSWTLGAGATQTLTATAVASGLPGNPVQFSASSATQIAVTQPPPANVNSGVNFTVTVQLRDAANALSPVNNLPLTISLASGAGTLTAGATPLTVNTTAGTATFSVNITGAAGARTLRITGAGVGNIVTTTVTIN